LLLALALPSSDPARTQALEQAAALDPESALALSELAKVRCAEEKCPEGVELSTRATDLAPGDPRMQAAAASVFLQAGDCGKAVAAQQRALEVLPHRATSALRKQLQTRLVELQRCSTK
jgi:predicted Zn-dependent protease